MQNVQQCNFTLNFNKGILLKYYTSAIHVFAGVNLWATEWIMYNGTFITDITL